MHVLFLLLVLWIWYAVSRRDPLRWPWHVRQRNPQEPVHWERVPPAEFTRSRLTLPPIRERIDSCWQDEAAYLAEFRTGWDHPEDLAACELVKLLYTPGRMYRAAIFRAGKRYQAVYETLLLYEEDELYWRPGESCRYGEWAWDRGEHWYDDPESAEEAARAVLHQLAAAERDILAAEDPLD